MSNVQIEPNDTAPQPSSNFVPRPRTLDGFALEHGCAEGIAIQSLDAGTVLSLVTRHSRYRMVILDGARQLVLVQGGRLFPEATEVRLEGATAGGTFLKIGWIGIGLRLELSIGSRRITSSRVASVTIESVPSPSRARLPL